MNDNEKLYNAITEIDGSYVDEAAGYEKPKPAPLRLRIIYAAAILLLILGAAFAVSRIIKKSAPQQETVLPSESAATETAAPAATDMPNNGPKPDPIVPGTKAYSLSSVITEWFQGTGEVGLAVFENGEQVSGMTVAERRPFSEIVRAFDGYLDTLYVYVRGEDFTSETEGSARRIDLTGGGASISVWEGTNYVRYVKDDFTRWFLLDGYTGIDHGSEFLYDELMASLPTD